MQAHGQQEPASSLHGVSARGRRTLRLFVRARALAAHLNASCIRITGVLVQARTGHASTTCDRPLCTHAGKRPAQLHDPWRTPGQSTWPAWRPRGSRRPSTPWPCTAAARPQPPRPPPRAQRPRPPATSAQCGSTGSARRGRPRSRWRCRSRGCASACSPRAPLCRYEHLRVRQTRGRPGTVGKVSDWVSHM